MSACGDGRNRLFFALVTIGQAVLFGGKKPRQASIVVGTALAFLAALIGIHRNASTGYPLWYLCAMVLISLIFGAIAGYLAGGLIAGIFLVLDRVERRRDASAQHQSPSLPTTAESGEEPTTPTGPS
jgi:hypothetical protein